MLGFRAALKEKQTFLNQTVEHVEEGLPLDPEEGAKFFRYMVDGVAGIPFKKGIDLKMKAIQGKQAVIALLCVFRGLPQTVGVFVRSIDELYRFVFGTEVIAENELQRGQAQQRSVDLAG